MEPIKELSKYDMHCRWELDGYNMKQVPDLHPKNFEMVMAKINELVVAINVITEHLRLSS